MSGAAALRQREAAVAAVVGTVALAMLAVTVDAVRFHLPELLGGERPALDGHTVALLVLLAVQAVVGVRAGRALLRVLAAQRRLRRLPVEQARTVGGHAVAVVGGAEPRAFCAGLLRPRVCVSASAVARLSADELRAVVEHEASHARRRDPLRLAVAEIAAAGLGFAAPLRRLPARQAELADLAADAAAVAALGSPRPLASALLRLSEPTPERVDHLLGRPLPVPSRGLWACAVGALAALGALVGALALLPTDPALPLLLLPAVALPALLALRASAYRP